ncbi:MAG: alanine:cation symporter family protein, partial [Plesiomonas shigelloides]
IDTLVICTMTGLALVVTGVGNTPLSGAAMTNAAFATGLNELGQWVVTIGLMFFAFTTILGWNYYGERCVTYLFGTKGIRPYRWIFILLVASGAFLKLDTIWILADIVNGLMAIPNLIALVGLRHVVVAETRDYFARMKLPREAVEAV